MFSLLKLNTSIFGKGFIIPFFMYLCGSVYCSAQIKTFDVGDFLLNNDRVIENCKLGYMTYGSLNADKSNAILFTTWYGGTSKDLEPYIGPERMLDTSKYFVIVIDAFGNGISSSPSNSLTQGNDLFPEFTIKDMVRAQYVLLTKHLNINHLYAVTGISMGGIQTYQWMASYPEFFDKAVPILGSPKLSSYDFLVFDILKRVMKSTSHSNTDATKTALMLEYLLGFTPRYRIKETPAEEYEDFVRNIEAQSSQYNIYDLHSQINSIYNFCIDDDSCNDQNTFQIEAFNGEGFTVIADQDHLLSPNSSRVLAKRMNTEILVLDSDCGHYAFSCEIEKISKAVGQFLDKK